jgi:hypothetical protein
MSTVSLNNDIVALAEREKAEVHRILLALTDAFRNRAEISTRCWQPRRPRRTARKGSIRGSRRRRRAGATDGGHLVRGARHPLLIPSVRDLLGNDGNDENDANESRPRRAPGPSQVVASNLSYRRRRGLW